MTVHVFDIINRLNYVKRFPLMSPLFPENEKHDILDTTACLIGFLAFEEKEGRGQPKSVRTDLLLNMLFHRAHKGLIGGFISPLKATGSPMHGHIKALKANANTILQGSVPFESTAIERALNIPSELVEHYIKPVSNLIKYVKCANEVHHGNREFKDALEQSQQALFHDFQYVPGLEDFYRSSFPMKTAQHQLISIDALSAKDVSRNDGLMYYVSKLDQIERWDMNPTLIKEDVKQHSADVAMFAALLGSAPDSMLDLEYIIGHAVFHDVTETIVSDVPNNIKHINPDMVSSFAKLEVLAAKQIQQVTHPHMQEMVYRYMLGDSKKVQENIVVKGADMLSAYAKSIEELKLSNRYFESIEKDIKAALNHQSESMPVLVECVSHIGESKVPTNAAHVVSKL